MSHGMLNGVRWGTFRRLAGAGLVWIMAAGLAAAQAPRSVTTGRGIGQELKELKKDILKPGVPEKSEKPAIKVDEDKAGDKPLPAAPAGAEGSGYRIQKIEIRGDADILQSTGWAAELRKQTEGKVLTDEQIQVIVRKIGRALLDSGYYLANVWTPPADYSKGILIVQVDKGRVGKMKFFAAKPGAKGETRLPYKGKYYSEEQLRNRLANLKEGQVFDYRPFYNAVYDINALMDVKMDTDLKVRRVQEGEFSRRVVDMEFTVEDSLPVHGALSVANSGTSSTGDWRPSLTVQHLNLTQHDDVLTLNVGPVSYNLSDLTSFGASYYLPNSWGKGGASTLYGGYSNLDTEQVVDGIDVRGNGWFTGFQQTFDLITSLRHQLNMSVGLTYQFMEDQLVLTEEGSEDWELDARQVTIVPLNLSFSYSSGRPDAGGGRNFLTSQTMFHQAGWLGASDEEEIQTLRVNAEGDFVIQRLQLSRIQPLFGKRDGAFGWLLFGRAEGQWASAPVVPAEQMAIGGMDSVRGFPERIVQGDNGAAGTLEIRTPIRSTFIGSPYKKPEDRKVALTEGRTVDRLQAVAFLDGGFVQIQESIGAEDSYSIVGAGVGFRLSLTQYSLIRFDWGFPLVGREDVETSEEPVSSGGRYHLAAQVQF